MNGVIYARYSSMNQREESIEYQLRICHEYAKNNDINIVGEYLDKGISAKGGNSQKREAFQRLLLDSNTNSFDTVLVFKIDRFSRDRFEHLLYRKMLLENGVKLISVTEPIADTPEGMFLQSMLESTSEYYIRNLSARVKGGHEQNAIKNLSNGAVVPYGYKISDHKYVENENESEAIRIIYNMFVDGSSFKAIADKLEKEGYRTRNNKRFSSTYMKRILSNEKYTGTYIYDGRKNEDGMDAIISKETYALAQKLLKNKEKTKTKGKKSTNYILSEKIVCSNCGNYFTGTSAHGRSDTYYYYTCSGKYKCKCKNQNIRKEFVENAIFNEIQKVLADDSIIDTIAKNIIELTEKEKKDDKRLSFLQSEAKKLDKEIKAMMESIPLAKASKQLLIDHLDELQERREIIQDSINSIVSLPDEIDENGIKEFLKMTRNYDADNHREFLLKSFIDQIILSEEDENGDRYATIFFNISKKTQKNKAEQLQVGSAKLTNGGASVQLPEPIRILGRTLVFYPGYFSLNFLLKKAV